MSGVCTCVFVCVCWNRGCHQMRQLEARAGGGDADLCSGSRRRLRSLTEDPAAKRSGLVCLTNKQPKWNEMLQVWA